jgi:hypothetical protein
LGDVLQGQAHFVLGCVPRSQWLNGAYAQEQD